MDYTGKNIIEEENDEEDEGPRVLQPSDAQKEMEQKNALAENILAEEQPLRDTIMNNDASAGNTFNPSNNRYTQVDSGKFGNDFENNNAGDILADELQNKRDEDVGGDPLTKNVFGLKIVMLGEFGVGKTSIIQRYVGSAIEQGKDFAVKTMDIDQENCAKLSIYDTAGEERGGIWSKAYYKDAHGAMLVYDIGDKNTFMRLNGWIQQISDNAPRDIVVMLVANKSDINSEMKNVSPVESWDFYKKNHWSSYIEISAKNGNNIAKAFEDWTVAIMQKQEEEKKNPNKVLRGAEQRNSLGLEDIKKREFKKKECCK